MINVNDFKPGITFLHNKTDILIVIESAHSKSGRGQAHVKVKAKNLRTQAIISITFTGGDTVYPAIFDKRPAIYSYDDGMYSVFMDNEDYNEIRIDQSRLSWEKKFLVPGNEVSLRVYKNLEILGIDLPPSVVLAVVDAPPGVKGNSVSNTTKTAILETGLQLQVPMFINNGDKIVVSTDEGKYKTRA
ncbi:elongation factor P [Spiroplasma endosymbiont of Aleiodes alternator]|uniref:elongation factor P n=1 Tax=Spiroplasma endosymbiont of Aleiodes alternator TaxID=3139329 RepID=UPI003CCB7212